jgi:hypothetical protein
MAVKTRQKTGLAENIVTADGFDTIAVAFDFCPD